MHTHTAEGSLKLALILTLTFFAVELVGAWWSGSLSLLGDAWHMLRDVFSLSLSLSAVIMARRLPTKTKTFGYHRLEILAAFLNGLVLLGITVWIFLEAYDRLLDPVPIQGVVMLLVGLLGLAVNIYVAFQLHGSEDLNVRSAFTHVLADTLSSGAVVAASVWIALGGSVLVDPLLGFGIAALILVSAVGIIRESLRILLEFTPPDVSFDEVVTGMESVPGVEEVHAVHLWMLCSNINVVDAHVVVGPSTLTETEAMKAEIRRRLSRYQIRHVTLEFECDTCATREKLRHTPHSADTCDLESGE